MTRVMLKRGSIEIPKTSPAAKCIKKILILKYQRLTQQQNV
jgi:hypothetical protein